MRSRPRAAALVAAASAAVALLLPGGAGAGLRPLDLGSAEPGFLSASPGRQAELFDRAGEAGAGIVRLNAFWFQIAPNEPLLPRNSDDPSYRLAQLDAAVRAADARGLRPMITLQRAPEWAEGGPNDEDRGTWKPDPQAFADFAFALAERYSGAHLDAANPGSFLPRVRFWQIWNEGNLEKFLAPQREAGQVASVEIYRDLINAAYPEIKSVRAGNRVIAAGSAPTSPSTEARTDPRSWWRQLLCLSRSLKPLSCPDPVHLDVFDHHPIAPAEAPDHLHRGWVTIANYGDLLKIWRAAEKQGTVLPGGTRNYWATEIYWETNPPDPVAGLRPRKAARYLEQGIYLLWKQGANCVFNFFLVDTPMGKPGALDNVQGGLYYADLTPKPSLTAYRFPFVTDRVGGGQQLAWGRPPVSGKLRIEAQRGDRWKALARLSVEARRPFRTRIAAKPGSVLRARVGPEVSLTWRVPG